MALDYPPPPSFPPSFLKDYFWFSFSAHVNNPQFVCNTTMNAERDMVTSVFSLCVQYQETTFFFFAYCEEWMVSWLLCFFFVPLLLYIMVECCRTLSLKVAFRPLIWLHCFAENNLAELLLCHVKWSVIHVPGIFVNAIWNGQSKFSILDYCKVDPFSNQQSPVKYRRGLIMLPRNANNILT